MNMCGYCAMPNGSAFTGGITFHRSTSNSVCASIARGKLPPLINLIIPVCERNVDLLDQIFYLTNPSIDLVEMDEEEIAEKLMKVDRNSGVYIIHAITQYILKWLRVNNISDYYSTDDD